ncbi:anti-sigma-D factor RsdA [Tsukamurella strandjordii]
MAGNDPRNPRDGATGDPRDPERTAAHRLGPPMRPMRPGGTPDNRNADTGFIDRVAAGGAVSTSDHTEFALASLLADWRDEIVTTPVAAGPSVDELMAEAERRKAGGDGAGVTSLADARNARRSRKLGLAMGSAAAAVAILGGGGVLVNAASPGDGALWSVKEVVFSDAASQTLATSEAKAQIESADRDASSGDQAAAQSALVSARQQAAKVKNDKQRAALEEQIRQAEARAGLPVGSTDLGATTSASASATAPVTVRPPDPRSSTSVPTTILPTPLPTTTVPYPTTTTPHPTTTTPPTTSTTTEPTTTDPATATTTTGSPVTTTTTVPPTATRPPVTTTTTVASSPTFTVERPGQLPG